LKKPLLIIVIPCFNERDVLPETAERLAAKLRALADAGIVSPDSSLLFVDDGSTDNTWALIEKYHSKDGRVFGGLKLQANSGHQSALLCGLLCAKEYADVTISIDADLQDDIEAIDKMLEKYLAGFQIVLGVHSSRKTDAVFKRASARLFYRLMRLMGSEIVEDHADFRLISREALNALAQDGAAAFFLRGAVQRLRFKTDVVYYERKERTAGKSKYTLRKMFKLALNGIIFYTVKPLRLLGKKRMEKKRAVVYHIEKTLPAGKNEN